MTLLLLVRYNMTVNVNRGLIKPISTPITKPLEL
jgi:hypothetical protein